MKRAALYLRVSSERQTVENQRPALIKLAKQRGFKVVATYEEKESAVKVRPQYDAMMAAAHAGAFDVLIIWALDRFGRSLMGNLTAVLDLEKRGVLVVSAKESFLELDGPVRSLLVMIFSWVAEQERSRLIERTRAGMDRARREGKQIGRPRALYSATAARALLDKNGATYASVARQLGVSESSVRRILSKGVSADGGAK